MKTFFYEAKDGPDKKVSGKIIASDKQEAVTFLESKNLTPIIVKEEAAQIKVSGRLRNAKVRLRDLIIFSKQLSGLLKSGVPILRSIHILSEQTENIKLKHILEDIAAKVQSGISFSSALYQYPKIFSQFFCAMIKSGEESGALDKTLYRLSGYYEKRDVFVNKARSAIIYPSLILAVGFFTVIFILTVVMPKIMPILIDLNANIHISTKILLGVSSFLKNTWHLWLFFFFLLVLILNRALKNASFREHLALLKNKIPLIGPLIFKLELSQFFRALSVVLEGGIPIVRAINITVPILNNPVLRKRMSLSADLLEKGGSWGYTLKEDKIYPPIVYNLILIGEETGNVRGALSEISDIFEYDIEENIKIIITLLEPCLILFVGLIIGFIVMALLLPVFELNFIQ
ncbi:MAG: type II secretion system F family protein [Candidatus Omnitrophica bacterium]|nr:type II secretion system F family protein [Candidatus Omnitrophota bacterium]MDD5081227.1 type II secretion system F family protein [Candidatus Omnitrophota bacterium]